MNKSESVKYLTSCKQHKNQSVESYSEIFLHFLSAANYEDDTRSVTTYIRGLIPPLQYEMFKLKPASLLDAVSAAKTCETAQKACFTQPPISSAAVDTDDRNIQMWITMTNASLDMKSQLSTLNQYKRDTQQRAPRSPRNNAQHYNYRQDRFQSPNRRPWTPPPSAARPQQP